MTLETEAILVEANAVVATKGAQAVGEKATVGLMVGDNAKVDNVQINIGTGTSSNQDCSQQSP